MKSAKKTSGAEAVEEGASTTSDEPAAQAQGDKTPEDVQAEIKPEDVRGDNKDGEVKPAAPIVYGDKVLTKKQIQQRTALRWFLMFVGITMMSCSVYFFQNPNNITLGGIAGIAMILASFIQPVVSFFSYDIIMAIINVLLLIIGLIILGKQCTVRTVVCSLYYTALITILEHFDVMSHISDTGTLTKEPFLELVYAILLFGVGGALVFNCGSSSGGTDIIALILKKFTNINVGMALMIIDMIVVLISFYTFSVECALFSVMGVFTKSFLLDGVIESIGKTKYITIITEHPEIISEYILKVIKHSFTVYDAEGGYSHNKKKVLITICKRNEALKLKIKIHEVDPQSFVIITDANEILGKGFGGTI